MVHKGFAEVGDGVTTDIRISNAQWLASFLNHACHREAVKFQRSCILSECGNIIHVPNCEQTQLLIRIEISQNFSFDTIEINLQTPNLAHKFRRGIATLRGCAPEEVEAPNVIWSPIISDIESLAQNKNRREAIELFQR